MKIQNIEVKEGDIVEIEYPTWRSTEKRVGKLHIYSSHTSIFKYDLKLCQLTCPDAFERDDIGNCNFNSKKIISIRKIGK